MGSSALCRMRRRAILGREEAPRLVVARKAVNNVIKHQDVMELTVKQPRDSLMAGAGGRTGGRQVLAEQLSLHHAVTVVESGILGNARQCLSRPAIRRTWRLRSP